ncbi:MAG: formate dehydrogenase accessory sulfurtransferase FdhD [Plesiomonas sp.]
MSELAAEALCRVHNISRFTLKTGSDERIASHKAGVMLPAEKPVALVYNGISHAVMMCSPSDLEDFALGFSLTEGIIENAYDVHDYRQEETSKGIELHIELANRCLSRLKTTRRVLAGRSGCGVCGAEQLDHVVRSVKPLSFSQYFSLGSLDRVLDQLSDRQVLGALTGATHAAIHLSCEGEILAIREDVGRHIALDKLIGHLCRHNCAEGAILVTSRASYEMVQKTVSAGIETLLAMSAVTEMAVEQAQKGNLTLLGFCRRGRAECYTYVERIR